MERSSSAEWPKPRISDEGICLLNSGPTTHSLEVAMSVKRALFTAVLVAVLSLCLQGDVSAQMQGHTAKGVWGLASGTQMPEGFLIAPVYVNYGASKLMDKDGEEIPDITGAEKDISVNALALLGWWVSPYEVFGANYGAITTLQFWGSRIEFASKEFESESGFGDLYLQPVNLGWHFKRLDVIASYGIYFPTGRYDAAADDNTGMGMWTHELGAGATVYYSEKRHWHLSSLAYFEMHSKKKDTDVEVGDILTLQGGLGRSFHEGALQFGVAYYAQWKVSADRIGSDSVIHELLDERLRDSKHRVYGLGPEVTVPIAKDDKLYALVTARYLWEFGARSNLQGNMFNLSLQFPFFADVESVN
jgi:hypothetical protein